MKKIIIMKKIFYLLPVIMAVFLASCEKDMNNPVLDLNKIVPPEIIEPANGSVIVLTEESAADSVLFKWKGTVYPTENLPATTYTLQLDVANGDFSNPVNLGNTVDTVFAVSQETLNLTILNNDTSITAGDTAEIQLRLVSYLVRTNAETWATSEVIKVKVKTYAGTPAEPGKLWVPGDYQGWNPATAPNIFSPQHDGVFRGYIYFPEGGTYQFKFTSAPDWNHTNFGSAGDGQLTTEDGLNNNLEVPGPGNYFLTADTINLTWSYDLRNFALIGSFNNWSGDEPLTWDNANWRWEITRDFEAGAEFKWRANGEWTYNLGKIDDEGHLGQDGDNIMIENAGNYTIYLYLYEPVPRYEIVQNK